MDRADKTRGEAEFDLIEFTPYLLSLATEVESVAFSSVYRSQFNMTRNEWRVMFHLGRYGDMTATEIGQRARTHKTKVSRAVRALEVKRFLARRTIETDRRSETLSLLPSGRAAYSELARRAAVFEAEFEKRIGTDDALLLRGILRRLVDLG